jgi:mannose-6-phosphate isomerase-like protein (cupin superfamily)
MEALARQRTGMTMLMRIERWDVRRDGPLSEASLRQKLQALGYEPAARSSAVERVATARGEGSERIEAVVSGLIKVTIDGESAILTAGDVVFVPSGAVRRVEVVGTGPASSLHAVYRTHSL